MPGPQVLLRSYRVLGEDEVVRQVTLCRSLLHQQRLVTHFFSTWYPRGGFLLPSLPPSLSWLSFLKYQVKYFYKGTCPRGVFCEVHKITFFLFHSVPVAGTQTTLGAPGSWSLSRATSQLGTSWTPSPPLHTPLSSLNRCTGCTSLAPLCITASPNPEA